LEREIWLELLEWFRFEEEEERCTCERVEELLPEERLTPDERLTELPPERLELLLEERLELPLERLLWDERLLPLEPWRLCA